MIIGQYKESLNELIANVSEMIVTTGYRNLLMNAIHFLGNNPSRPYVTKHIIYSNPGYNKVNRVYF